MRFNEGITSSNSTGCIDWEIDFFLISTKTLDIIGIVFVNSLLKVAYVLKNRLTIFETNLKL